MDSPSYLLHKRSSKLFDACCEGHLDVVLQSLSPGSDLNWVNDVHDERTPLTVSAQAGHSEIVSALLSAGGAKVDLPRPFDGASALLLASKKGHLDIVETLLHAGADVNLQQIDLTSPLWHAVLVEKKEVVRLLLKKGAFVDTSRPFDGMTVIHLAAFGSPHYLHSEKLDILESLLKAGGNFELPNIHTGATPLWASCFSGKKENASLLLQYGAQYFSFPFTSGNTPMMIASHYKHKHVVSQLMHYTIRGD